MKEEWKVFYNRQTGEQLTAYTLRGTFPGEERATVELLAEENGIAPENITVRIETRQ